MLGFFLLIPHLNFSLFPNWLFLCFISNSISVKSGEEGVKHEPVDGRAERVLVEEDDVGLVGGEGGRQVAGDLRSSANNSNHLPTCHWNVNRKEN